jgi:hypothetical protein
VPLDSEEARCAHSELSKFELTVFGANGCNVWELRSGLAQQARSSRSRSRSTDYVALVRCRYNALVPAVDLVASASARSVSTASPAEQRSKTRAEIPRVGSR